MLGGEAEAEVSCRGWTPPHDTPGKPPAASTSWDLRSTVPGPRPGRSCLPRPKSLLGSCPSTRLLSLEEAQARTQAQHAAPGQAKSPEPELGRGPSVLPAPQDSPHDRRRARGGSWKTFFALGKVPAAGRKRSQRPAGLLGGDGQTGLRTDTVTLRSAKSEESLTSQSSTMGLHKLHRLRRPRSSSDAFPALPGAPPSSPPASLKPCHSCESLSYSASSSHSASPEVLPDWAPRHRTSLWLDDEGELDSDPELSPPGFLDLDPLPCRRSPPRCLWISDAAPSPTRLPFARKVARALSPRSPPPAPEPLAAPLEISEPVAVSLPAKVLEMLGGSEAGRVLSPGGRRGARSPPHMISRLLQAGNGQLSEGCQREVRRKLTQVESGSLAQSPEPETSPLPPGALSLFRHLPPPPPPKDPARLMALALAESAHRAARQQQGALHREQRAQFRRSLSLEGEGAGAGALYSMVRPAPAPAAQPPGPSLQRQQSEGGAWGQRRERTGAPQIPLVQAPVPGGQRGRPSSAAPPRYGKTPPDARRWDPRPCQPRPPPLPQALDPAPHRPLAPPKPPAPLHFHNPPPAYTAAAPPWLGSPRTAPLGPPEPQLHQPHSFPAPRPLGAATPPRHPLLEATAENLYYEIVSEPPVYPPRPWPLGPPRPPEPPEYLAALNASYGVFQRPWPGPSAPTPPLRAVFEDGRVRYELPESPEPVYVNFPFVSTPAGPEAGGHHRDASPPSSSSSASASPSPEGGHQRSRSDPGAAPGCPPVPGQPALPQKQRLGPQLAPGWAYGPRAMPGLYRQLLDVLPCSGTMLRFYRPLPPSWEPAAGYAPRFAAYDEPPPRPPALLNPCLMDSYRLGPYPPYTERPPPQYGNVERKEGPAPAPRGLAPTWTVRSEGQTRSYC